jgi:DHA1 family inner membrane transport protein
VGEAGPAAVSPVLLRVVGFISFFDRFSTAPMLVVLAARVGVSLEAAIQLTTLYAVLYGAGQPVWGFVSDRIGRVTVLRIALAGAVIGSIASIAIPGYLPLLISRAFTGLMVGALYPTLLTIFGDTLSGTARYREISNLQTVSALGTTGATLVAGAIAVVLDWRVVFAVTIVAASIVLIPLMRVRNVRPPRTTGQLRTAVRGWPLWVYGIGFVEGLVLLGVLTYIVPAMEHVGVPVAIAGLLAATYGIGIVVGSRLVQPVSRRIARPFVLLIGGVLLIAAYTVATLSESVIALTVTALLIGLANSFMHSTIQGWVTAVSPTARATTVSIFAASLFLGSGVATGVTAGFAAHGGYRVIFAITAAVSVLLVAAATLSFRRWLRTHSLG